MTWTSTGRTATPAWRKLRAAVLARDPICTLCWQARSRHVDHIIPHSKGGPDQVWNLRGVCIPCHAKLTAQQAAKARWPVARRRLEEPHPGRPNP